jgi:NADH-quinone oxidoreductase subunit J
MESLFYISSVIAIIATIMVITRHHPIHALLYLVVSFLAIAMIFVAIGAPFVGVLEVIIYAGAIMVLFIFVVMMLNLDKVTSEQEKQWLKPNVWIGPSILSVLLVEPKQVSLSLFGKYVIGVELVGFLLMSGIVGAAHIGKHKKKNLHRYLTEEPERNPYIPESKTELIKTVDV